MMKDPQILHKLEMFELHNVSVSPFQKKNHAGVVISYIQSGLHSEENADAEQECYVKAKSKTGGSA
jgi:hypothetical protein